MIDYFHSRAVGWDFRFVNLTRATWHSCMKWGWPSIERGEHLAEWRNYWVFSIKVGTWGWSWQWWPKRTFDAALVVDTKAGK